MTIGFAGVFAGVVVLLLRSIMGSQIVGSLTDDASLQVTSVLMRQTAREFPAAQSGAATQAIRTRLKSLGARRRAARNPAASAPAGPTTAEQLKQLADLREQGAISPDEYRGREGTATQRLTGRARE